MNQLQFEEVQQQQAFAKLRHDVRQPRKTIKRATTYYVNGEHIAIVRFKVKGFWSIGVNLNGRRCISVLMFDVQRHGLVDAVHRQLGGVYDRENTKSLIAIGCLRDLQAGRGYTLPTR